MTRVRINHTHTLELPGWRRTASGEYTHASGIKVRRVSSGAWEIIGASAYDGYSWTTMHTAMLYAAKQEAM